MKMPWRQYYSFKSGPVVITFALFLQSNFIESISKIGFWFKIPSSLELPSSLKLRRTSRRDTRGGAEFKTGGILWYVEDFKLGTNKRLGQKTFLR
jgi:hypothetical protein